MHDPFVIETVLSSRAQVFNLGCTFGIIHTSFAIMLSFHEHKPTVGRSAATALVGRSETLRKWTSLFCSSWYYIVWHIQQDDMSYYMVIHTNILPKKIYFEVTTVKAHKTKSGPVIEICF